MNKFLKHKVAEINRLQKTLIIQHLPLRPHFVEGLHYSNRELNHALRTLRGLPKELLISSNPDIQKAADAYNASLNGLARDKLNMNQQFGAFGSGPMLPLHIQTGPDSVAVIAQQYAKRKERKQRSTELRNTLLQLCGKRLLELNAKNIVTKQVLHKLWSLLPWMESFFKTTKQRAEKHNYVFEWPSSAKVPGEITIPELPLQFLKRTKTFPKGN